MEISPPSDESLGYFQSSALADWGTSLLCKAKPSVPNDHLNPTEFPKTERGKPIGLPLLFTNETMNLALNG